jgi:hypothetical protein
VRLRAGEAEVTNKRRDRYISQMEAFRRAHYGIGESVQLLSFEEPQQTRFTYSDEQYACIEGALNVFPSLQVSIGEDGIAPK